MAEDLAQEAFVALSSQFEQVDNSGAFIHRAVINQARTWQRNERRSTLKLLRVSRDLGPLDPRDTQSCSTSWGPCPTGSA